MRVLNKWTDIIPADAVEIMRPGKWGNRFVIGQDGTREQVIEKHRLWLPAQPRLVASLHELLGHDLVCCCAPKACHGNTLRDFVIERMLL